MPADSSPTSITFMLSVMRSFKPRRNEVDEEKKRFNLYLSSRSSFLRGLDQSFLFRFGLVETDFAEIAPATPGDQSCRCRFVAAVQSSSIVTATYNSAAPC